MFGNNLKLFDIFGFEVRVNISWAFLAVLIAVSLATGFFPAVYEGWPDYTYWWLAVAGVIGVFFSIVIHELSHSLAARAFGMEMGGITLFLFGGLAEMEEDPTSPKAEFVIALAGPLISIVLAALLLLTAQPFIPAEGNPTPIGALLAYLGWLNAILAIFNLIPAFPLDGGRALRAVFWGVKGDYMWATKWSSRIGAGFGIALMLLGLFSAIQGALVQGLWWILIGMFVRAVAKSSYQDLQNRRLLSGETASDVMQGDPHPVSADMTLQELVDHHVLQFRQTNFPVTDNGRLKGVIGTANLRSVDREEWPSTAVRDVMTPVEDADLISPDTSAATALQKLNQKGAEALIVARGERPLGLISREHLVQLLDLRSRFKPAG